MALHKLIEKGFVSFIKKGKVRHYQAVNPEGILRFIEEKKGRFKKLLPELLIKQQQEEKQEAEIFEGFKGFKNMLYELIKDGKKRDEYLFFSFYANNPDDFEYIYNFYTDFDRVRQDKGIKVKGIAPLKLKAKLEQRKYPKIKYVDFPIPTNISIFKDKVIFTPFEEKQISFLIHSKQLAESFRKYFYSIWDK